MIFKNILTSIGCVICFVSLAHAQQYQVSAISKDLMKNAKAVVRLSESTFEVTSTKSAVETIKYAITILNNNGVENSKFTEYYDKFTKITNIKATVYDANGNEVKKIPQEKIKDYAAVSGYSIYEDNRAKYIDPEYRQFPFTVEYSYQIKYFGMLSYSDWLPYDDYNVSVENSSLTIIMPPNLKLRFLAKNTSLTPEITSQDNHKVYKWATSNLPALKEEAFSLPMDEYLPIVYTSPSDFEIDNYAGNMDSWQNFGKWILKLNEGRGILNFETQNHIKSLVANVADTVEKIKILYEFLQNKTRYVSVQVGIGGWQPFEASTVDKVSYGDCKALSNYMKSILDVVGIKSYYTLIMAGRNAPPMITEFPSSQFNHATLCVPLQSDSIWLECTSQDQPFAYIGTFTDNRDALLITEDGGVLAHTKSYSSHNIQNRKAIVNLNTDLSATALVTTKCTGMFYDNLYWNIHSDDVDKKKRILRNIHLPNFEMVNFKYTEDKSMLPSITEQLSLNLSRYTTTIHDTIMLLPLVFMANITDIPQNTNTRLSDIYIRRPYLLRDTVVYNLPVNYTVNQLPESIVVNSIYGKYSSNIQNSGTQLIYVRQLSINQGRYPAADYKNFVSFFEEINQADNVKCFLTSKQ